jgi:hypothetical protein
LIALPIEPRPFHPDSPAMFAMNAGRYTHASMLSSVLRSERAIQTSVAIRHILT